MATWKNPLGITGPNRAPSYYQPGSYDAGFHSGYEVLGGITIGGCEFCGGTLQRIGSNVRFVAINVAFNKRTTPTETRSGWMPI